MATFPLSDAHESARMTEHAQSVDDVPQVQLLVALQPRLLRFAGEPYLLHFVLVKAVRDSPFYGSETLVTNMSLYDSPKHTLEQCTYGSVMWLNIEGDGRVGLATPHVKITGRGPCRLQYSLVDRPCIDEEQSSLVDQPSIDQDESAFSTIASVRSIEFNPNKEAGSVRKWEAAGFLETVARAGWSPCFDWYIDLGREAVASLLQRDRTKKPVKPRRSANRLEVTSAEP